MTGKQLKVIGSCVKLIPREVDLDGRRQQTGKEWEAPESQDDDSQKPSFKPNLPSRRQEREIPEVEYQTLGSQSLCSPSLQYVLFPALRFDSPFTSTNSCYYCLKKSPGETSLSLQVSPAVRCFQGRLRGFAAAVWVGRPLQVRLCLGPPKDRG